MRTLAWLLLGAAPLILTVLALAVGRYPVQPLTALQIAVSPLLPIAPDWLPVEETVVLTVRLPRVLLALLIGGGLSVAGAAIQGIFGNPLVSPTCSEYQLAPASERRSPFCCSAPSNSCPWAPWCSACLP